MNRSLSSMTLLTFHGISAPSSKRSPLIHSVRNPPGLFCQPSPRSVPVIAPPLPPRTRIDNNRKELFLAPFSRCWIQTNFFLFVFGVCGVADKKKRHEYYALCVNTRSLPAS